MIKFIFNLHRRTLTKTSTDRFTSSRQTSIVLNVFQVQKEVIFFDNCDLESIALGGGSLIGAAVRCGATPKMVLALRGLPPNIDRLPSQIENAAASNLVESLRYQIGSGDLRISVS